MESFQIACHSIPSQTCFLQPKLARLDGGDVLQPCCSSTAFVEAKFHTSAYLGLISEINYSNIKHRLHELMDQLKTTFCRKASLKAGTSFDMNGV